MKNIMLRVPDRLSMPIGRALLHVKGASPTVLFAGGVVGVVATTVIASRATLKLPDIIEEAENTLEKARLVHSQERDNYSDQDYARDVTIIYSRAVVDVAKLYTPAIIIGTLSIAALTGSHHILKSRNTGLMAAYAALDKGFGEYQARVRNAYGDEADRAFKHGVEKRVEEVKDKEDKPVKRVHYSAYGPSVYSKFFDQMCPSWNKNAEYNRIFLQCHQNHANDLLKSRGHVFLNEVYDMLGIERTKAGSVVGWVLGHGGDDFIDFGIFNGSNEKVRDFMNGREGAILLDFNVDGLIYDKI